LRERAGQILVARSRLAGYTNECHPEIRMPVTQNTPPVLGRRTFLELLAAPLVAAAAPQELRCDVAVIGGGVGGCAAAIGALRNGMSVVMTEETDWIGGQLTAQAVP